MQWKYKAQISQQLTLLQMSNSTSCNLEEVMRSLSISSADEVGGGVFNRLEDKPPSGQGAVDEVFVDGDVAEERGKGNTLDQRELLDTTDALLMDATNKMDDTAFLDEVIARNCRSFGSTDDDYIDEVIARCCCLDLIILLIVFNRIKYFFNCFQPHQMFEGRSNVPWRICWMVIMET